MGNGIRERRTRGDIVTQIQSRPVALLLPSCAIVPAWCPSLPSWAPHPLAYRLPFSVALSLCHALYPSRSWPLSMPCLQAGLGWTVQCSLVLSCSVPRFTWVVPSKS